MASTVASPARLNATTSGSPSSPQTNNTKVDESNATTTNMSAAQQEQDYFSSIGRSKEPAVVAAEKLMSLLSRNIGMDEVMGSLDAAITFISPMAYYRGRPVVKAWIQFEAKMLIPFHPYIRIKDIVAEDEMKCAVVRWSIGGLHFTDRIQLSSLLQYQTITRSMVRGYRSLDDKLIAEEVLRLWTGPHFANHCEPKQGTIDNATLVLPTLDFSHLRLRDYKQLLTAQPSGASTARPINDMNVVYHFMSDGLVKAQIESEKRKEAEEEKSRKTNFAKGHGNEQFVIRAKNRDGDKKVLVIDKSDFFRTTQGSKVEQMQDDEVTGLATKHDRPRFICSCIRLRNNFFGAAADEHFDANGKLIDPSDPSHPLNTTNTAAGAGAAAAARLAASSSSSSSANNNTHEKNGKKSPQEIAAAAAAASELGTVLKLITMNSFFFVTNIDLSSNKLTTIPDLSELPLVGLSLHDNRITSWEEVEVKLKPLKLLQNLTLFANPIQKEAGSVKDYKYSILSIFYTPKSQALRSAGEGGNAKTSTASGAVGGGGRRSSSSLGMSNGHSYTSGQPPKSLNISRNYYAAAAAAGAANEGNLTTVGGAAANKNNTTTASSLPPVVAASRGTTPMQNNNRMSMQSNTTGNANNNGSRLNTSGGMSQQQQRIGGGASSSSSDGGAVITLRSLDHCVVSPKEAEVVRTFLKTFVTRREQAIKAERSSHHQQQQQHAAKNNGNANSSSHAVGTKDGSKGPSGGGKSVAALRGSVAAGGSGVARK